MNDDAVEPLEKRLAYLKAEIDALGADPANDGERRILEAQAGKVVLRDRLRKGIPLEACS